MISAKRVYDSIVRANCPFILPISTCALLPNQWRFVASSQQSHFITNLHRANGSSFFWRIKSISIDIYSYSFTHDFRYIINFILSHYQAKSELSIDFLFIIEKRPFPAMTCRRTLEMEMKALLVSERIAQSSPRFLSSIWAASNNSCVVHDVRHVRIIFELFSTGDGTRSGQRDLRSYLLLLRFNIVVTNLISKKREGLCLNPQTWPMTLAQPRLRAHPVILQWYKFYGSFLWYPILSFQQRSPFLSFFHNRILLGVI